MSLCYQLLGNGKLCENHQTHIDPATGAGYCQIHHRRLIATVSTLCPSCGLKFTSIGQRKVCGACDTLC